MPSLPIELLLRHLVPSLIIFHGGSSSHRLKHLEKSDRRGFHFQAYLFRFLRGYKGIRQGIGDQGFVLVLSLGIVKGRESLLLFVLALRIEIVAASNVLFKFLIQSMDIHSPANDVHEDFINNLESTFIESLHIHDARKPNHGPEWDDNYNMGEGKICGDLEQQETERNKKFLKKCSAFPYPDMMLPPSSSDDENDTSLTESVSKQSPLQTNSCSISLPEAPKLSAMKGSHEKQGVPQMKLTVKWAPDVYDPVPTLLSHCQKQETAEIQVQEE